MMPTPILSPEESPSAIEAIATLLVRFWALTSAAAQLPLFLSTLPFIPQYIEEATGPMMIGYTNPDQALLRLLQLLIFPAYAALWFTARPIGRWIARPLSKTSVQIVIDGVTLLTVGTALIGLYIIALYIPTFIQEGGRWLLTIVGLWQPDPNERWVPWPAPYISLFAGLAVFLSAFRIGALAKYLRSAGLPKD